MKWAEIFIRNPMALLLTRDGMEFPLLCPSGRRAGSQLEWNAIKTCRPPRTLAFPPSIMPCGQCLVSLLKKSDMEKYELFLRGTRTWEIIDDVKNFP